MKSGGMRLQRHLRDDRHTLYIAGDLAVGTVPELIAAVERLLAQAVSCISLDIAGVTFMDSTGLRAILTIHKLYSAPGCDFSITRGQAQVQRLFEIAGVAHTMSFTEPKAPDDDARESYARKRRRFADGMTREYLRRVST